MNRQEWERKSLEYIRDDNQWVLMVCPLIRHKPDGFKEAGYMVTSKLPVIVYLGNIYNAKQGDPVIGYKSHEAVIADGWLVD